MSKMICSLISNKIPWYICPIYKIEIDLLSIFFCCSRTALALSNVPQLLKTRKPYQNIY